jgi:hypothetical protein
MKALGWLTYWLATWLLLLAFPFLWGLSYLRHETWLWTRGHRHSVLAITDDGTLTVIVTQPHVFQGAPPAFMHFTDNILRDELGNLRAGLFDIGGKLTPRTPEYRRIHLPWMTKDSPVYESGPDGFAIYVRWWILCVPVPICMLRAMIRFGGRWRNRRRRRRGLCIACGYDLRHSSDRCPECGTPVASVASASAAG